MDMYAEEYTKREKLIRLGLIGAIGAAVVFFSEYWLFPLIEDFAVKPDCYQVFDIQIGKYIWYLILCGLPLSMFLLTLPLIPFGIRGLQDGQYPPKGTKVYRKTAIRFGTMASLQSSVQILIPLLLFCLSVWGYFQAAALSPVDLCHLDPALCQP